MSSKLLMLRLCLPVLAAIAAPATVNGQEGDGGPPADGAEESGGAFWGLAKEEYCGRFALGRNKGVPAGQLSGMTTDDQQDHDLRLLLLGGIEAWDGVFEAELDSAAWWDLDGTNGGGSPVFASMRDSPDIEWDIYSAWGQINLPKGGAGSFLRMVRAGRQTANVGLPATFDGARADLNRGRSRVDLFLFGGRTKHFFEKEDAGLDDWIASGGATLRILPQLKLSADYRFQTEVGDLQDAKRRTDHGYGTELRFMPNTAVRLASWARGLDDHLSHAGAAGRLEASSIGVGGIFRLEAQTVTLEEVVEDMNPYFSILGSSLPHLRWAADLWKDVDLAAVVLSFHTGWKGRALLEGIEGEFNRNFGKVYLMATLEQPDSKGGFVHAMAEVHTVTFSLLQSY